VGVATVQGRFFHAMIYFNSVSTTNHLVVEVNGYVYWGIAIQAVATIIESGITPAARADTVNIYRRTA